MQYSSFEKGDFFENFVADQLFITSAYDLIYRTNSYDQNKKRFAEYTLKPDFKFRCKNTGKEFYVEAKYRSGFNSENKIEVISYEQIERFKTYQREENIPVFIVIGYGNTPDNPACISLIPLDELIYLDLYGSFLKRYRIEKRLVDSASLNLTTKEELNPSGRFLVRQIEKQDDKSKEKSKNFATPFLKKNRKLFATGIGLVLVAFAFLNLSNFSNNSMEENLKERTRDYYDTIHSGNIDALENFINPIVDTWYSRSNITYSEIKRDTKAYNKRHPSTSTDIQWDTFMVTSLNDGYAVTYNMIYKLLKENKGKDIIYHLKIHAVWDKDLKLKSMYEEKL